MGVNELYASKRLDRVHRSGPGLCHTINSLGIKFPSTVVGTKPVYYKQLPLGQSVTPYFNTEVRA